MAEDSPKPGVSRRKVAVTVEAESLEAEEERVLRALHGSEVPDTFPLEQKDEGLSETVRAQLRAIEQTAFERAGRLEELRADLDAAEEEESARERTRAKIVRGLRGDSAPAGDD